MPTNSSEYCVKLGNRAAKVNRESLSRTGDDFPAKHALGYVEGAQRRKVRRLPVAPTNFVSL